MLRRPVPRHGITKSDGDVGNAADGLAALVRAMALRDATAIQDFQAATFGPLCAIANRILRNHADAEEIVSDVYLRVWFNAEFFDPALGSARAWVNRICRNAALDRIRSFHTQRRHNPFAHISDAEYCESPECWLEEYQDSTAVRAALRRLSSRHRQLLELAFFDDKSHGQISHSEKLPLGTVKSSLRRSLKRLQRDLDEEASTRKVARL
jgi:RNA polymerase sigma-70 factor, ECF subfamily